MTKIDFYYDPSCPFCWITSRWLLMVSPHRDIDITWRPFSLALKNDELVERENETEHAKSHRDAHRVHRVIEAARAQGVSVIDLYTIFGVKYHAAGFPYDDTWIANVLEELQLPAELAAAADDPSYDAHLQDELQSALEVAGEDIGVPTIVFYAADGSKQGYFGPVLQSLPDLNESLELWDGLSKLATSTAFYELKRSRPSGNPDVASTAKC